MPNWVKNKLYFNCSETIRKVLLKTIQADGEPLGSIDFNKLIPMPVTLNVEAGSRGEEGYKLYKEYLDEVRYVSSEEDRKAIYNSYLEKCGDDPEQFELGKQYYENERDYGVKTWYDWRCENWDTKWNACDCEPKTIKDNYIVFNTAWSRVVPIISKLSTLFPDILFTYAYADEDLGYNCGMMTFQDGMIMEEVIPDQGETSGYQLAAEVWGYTAEEVKEWYDFEISNEPTFLNI